MEAQELGKMKGIASEELKLYAYWGLNGGGVKDWLLVVEVLVLGKPKGKIGLLIYGNGGGGTGGGTGGIGWWWRRQGGRIKQGVYSVAALRPQFLVPNKLTR